MEINLIRSPYYVIFYNICNASLATMGNSSSIIQAVNYIVQSIYVSCDVICQKSTAILCPVSSIYIQTHVNVTQSNRNYGCSIVETENGMEIGRKREGWSL